MKEWIISNLKDIIEIGILIGGLITIKLWFTKLFGITPGLDKENKKNIEEIKDNHLFHIQEDLKDIKEGQKEIMRMLFDHVNK
jgi:hypothetical protein